MEGKDRGKTREHICVGLLAHVDAGKTTLSEAILYLTGSIRRLGRVDHQDAFLDNFELERARGITIFSKQAELMLGDVRVTLMDTPGHVDFSAEMERTLQVLDYAVLVVSGADGVQGHTETLWRLLARYEIPVFLFINKMDQPGTDRAALMDEIGKRLDSRCVDFGPLSAAAVWADTETGSVEERLNAETGSAEERLNAETGSAKERLNAGIGAERAGKESGARASEPAADGLDAFWETLAMCDEELLEQYLAKGELGMPEIARAVSERRVFPCYFGSALKLQGVQELLGGLQRLSAVRSYPQDFGARVFKITRDAQGNRLTHMKITGGSLKVKEALSGRRGRSGEPWEQKADQIRVYSGGSFQTVREAQAGMVCAVTGLDFTYAGEGLGAEPEGGVPLLEPVLSYRIELPPECDAHYTFLKLRQLEEEEPQLHIVWDERLGEIHAHLMGEVQIGVLRSMIRERFGIWVEFGQGSIVYKETIRSAVEGMGHFEPLRHYAEVHLLLEPGERGSGLQFASRCSEDVLDRSWQRLILTHLEEKKHVGVLTGSEITDMRITLLTGRAHLKHTEGGDFRQATYRAVRHGLKCAESVLLEPVYEFRLEVPAESVGRAMTDIQKMSGSFAPPETEGETAVLSGQAPVSEMWGYQTELLAYTKGRGRLSCSLKGYEECHNAQEVIEAAGYDSEADLENPTGSVFCAHGAGYVVSWENVQDYMHMDSGWKPDDNADGERDPGSIAYSGRGSGSSADGERRPGNNTDGGRDPGSSANSGRRSGSSADGERRPGNNTDGGRKLGGRADGERKPGSSAYAGREPGSSTGGSAVDEKELEAIFTRTYGASSLERKRYAKSRRVEAPGGGRAPKQEIPDGYLLVDGYNIIFAWDGLRELAETSIEGARGKLMDILSNYQGYRGIHVILVYDAYKVEGGRGEVQKYHNIHVVYTKEAETADQYIEKTARVIGRKYHVTVATSDALEQIIILGAGASRMSAEGLLEEVRLADQEIRAGYLEKAPGTRHRLFDELDGPMKEFLEELRLGRRTLDRARKH